MYGYGYTYEDYIDQHGDDEYDVDEELLSEMEFDDLIGLADSWGDN